jgi:phospholipase C
MLVISSCSFFGGSAITTTTSSSSSSLSNTTNTPIKHLVVIFQENISFDHYFATYPNATNPKGQPKFIDDPHTPAINGLKSSGLLTDNSNVVNPFRFDRSQAITCDMNHEFTAEQKVYNGRLLDKFVKYTSSRDPGCTDIVHRKQVMGYYDGDTVTALWNYAQHFALNDNSFNTIFGPSTPAVFNLIAWNTHGTLAVNRKDDEGNPSGVINGSVLGDADSKFDVCGKPPLISMTGKNIGDLLN